MDLKELAFRLSPIARFNLLIDAAREIFVFSVVVDSRLLFVVADAPMARSVHSEAGSWPPTSLRIGRGQEVHSRQNISSH
jgi:hypothetical protein